METYLHCYDCGIKTNMQGPWDDVTTSHGGCPVCGSGNWRIYHEGQIIA